MTPARRSPSMLFSPFQLRDVRFPNRIVIGPMQMYVAGADGAANDWHFQHLAKYAVGGAGTVMTEALIVDPTGRNTYADCGIWSTPMCLRSSASSTFSIARAASRRRSYIIVDRRRRGDVPGKGWAPSMQRTPPTANHPGSPSAPQPSRACSAGCYPGR